MHVVVKMYSHVYIYKQMKSQKNNDLVKQNPNVLPRRQTQSLYICIIIIYDMWTGYCPSYDYDNRT